ncbi:MULTISPECIES: hypothetical protein [unclassified Ruegeria]|uniref:hypothetical protein n=1 Tax=unclassified Ruegeria TaxID=2625375 RepID=UPI001488C3DD|nr:MULTISPECIES: hypothetical protein [unclassified Ruegeria]
MARPASFEWINTRPEIICLTAMRYTRFPLSFRNMEDQFHECGFDASYEAVWYRSSRFGPMCVLEIRTQRLQHASASSKWKRHVDEELVKVNSWRHLLWRGRSSEYRGGQGGFNLLESRRNGAGFGNIQLRGLDAYPISFVASRPFARSRAHQYR